MLCPNCSKELPDDSKFCDGCGNSVSVEENKDSSQNSNFVPQPEYTQPASKPSPQNYQPNNYSQNAPASEHRPLTIGDYIIMMILTAIPIVGFVMLLIWTFSSSTNLNKKNYAIATLIMMVIGIVLVIVFSTVIVAMVGSMSYYW